MALGPWSISPAWQNFCSLYREAITAIEARTDLEKSHQMTAALYFGIACLEAFINQKMREYMAPDMSADDIYRILRKGRVAEKLNDWPKQITGKDLAVGATALVDLTRFRGHLNLIREGVHDAKNKKALST